MKKKTEMGREEEELRYKSAQDQQTRWRSHVFTGAQKVQHQPLAPQLQLNSAYRGDDDDDGAEFRGAAAAPAAAAPAAAAAAPAAPVASAGLARTSGEVKARARASGLRRETARDFRLRGCRGRALCALQEHGQACGYPAALHFNGKRLQNFQQQVLKKKILKVFFFWEGARGRLAPVKKKRETKKKR